MAAQGWLAIGAPNSQRLTVRFRDRTRYQFHGVPEHLPLSREANGYSRRARLTVVPGPGPLILALMKKRHSACLFGWHGSDFSSKGRSQSQSPVSGGWAMPSRLAPTWEALESISPHSFPQRAIRKGFAGSARTPRWSRKNVPGAMRISCDGALPNVLPNDSQQFLRLTVPAARLATQNA
jgi:hypothetical protein